MTTTAVLATENPTHKHSQTHTHTAHTHTNTNAHKHKRTQTHTPLHPHCHRNHHTWLMLAGVTAGEETAAKQNKKGKKCSQVLQTVKRKTERQKKYQNGALTDMTAIW